MLQTVKFKRRKKLSSVWWVLARMLYVGIAQTLNSVFCACTLFKECCASWVFKLKFVEVISPSGSRKSSSSLCWAAAHKPSLAASAPGTGRGWQALCRLLGCHHPPSLVPPKPCSPSERLAGGDSQALVPLSSLVCGASGKMPSEGAGGEEKSADFFRGALCEGPSSLCTGSHKRARKEGWPPDPQPWPNK